MAITDLFFNFVQAKIKTQVDGLITYLINDLNKIPILTPRDETIGLYNMLNLSNNEITECTTTPDYYIDFDFGQYYVQITDYMLQGDISKRCFKEWEFQGRNSLLDNWKRIDYKYNDYICGNNNYQKQYRTCSEPTEPFRYMRFIMHKDIENQGYFRLKCFEIYGTLWKRKAIAKYSFHFNFKIFFNYLLIII